MNVTVAKLNGYDRIIRCPSDKSVSIRAVILCSFTVGMSTVYDLSLCDDVMSAIECMRALGAKIELDGNVAHITGAPFRSAKLDCGNSATVARLLIGLLAGLNGVFELYGDKSLSERPMKRVTDPLRLMGARIEDNDGKLPVRIIGSPLGGLQYFMPISSAQVKSALLLAGLSSANGVTVTEKIKTRDHTEDMLGRMHAAVTVDGNTVKCKESIIYGADFTVGGDFSAAIYPIVLALISGGKCTVQNVGLNKTRTHALSLLKAIGANVCVGNERGECGDITAVGGNRLRPVFIGENDVPQLIDEIPALCLLACFTDGISVIEGASELRNKESDRITATVNALRALGANIEEKPDGMIVFGGKKLEHGVVDCRGDHRIAMLAAVAGAAGNGAEIIGGECVSVSYPSFFEEVIGE